MLAEPTRHLLVQPTHLLLKEMQLLQSHLEQPPLDGVELGAGAERVAQLCWRGSQALSCHGSQSRGVGRSVGQRLQKAILQWEKADLDAQRRQLC
jgi:hypothetical protein